VDGEDPGGCTTAGAHRTSGGVAACAVAIAVCLATRRRRRSRSVD
jgi:hypothetical protein